MAFENLFIRTKRDIEGIQLDAVLREDHSNDVSLTTNPVESGVRITDHAVLEPRTLTIVAEVTDTPLGTAAVGQLVNSASNLFGTSTEDNITRSVAAYRALIDLQEKLEPISVQTKLRLYEDMMITGISSVTDKKSFKSVPLIIKLTQVIISKSEIIELTEDELGTGATAQQGASSQDRGRQELTPPAATTEKTLLKTLGDWIGG